MTLSIISTNKVSEPWVDALRAVDSSVDIQVWPHETNKQDVEFALCWNHPHGLLQEYPNLKCISSMGAGIDHFLSDYLLPKQVPLVRIVDANLAQSMFEYICSAVMYFTRNFDRFNLQQKQSYWLPHLANSNKETRIGIMGLGMLGSYSAEKLSEMGFKVSGWSSSAKSIPGVISFAGNEQLDKFVSQTDILLCLLPLTNQTRGILNLELFNKLPKGACVINVARGEHLNESDLITALDNFQLKGACLDVFKVEPLPKNHPFWQHEKIVVTPHCSSITDPVSVAPQIVENYHRMLKGEPLLNQVDLTRGY